MKTHPARNPARVVLVDDHPLVRVGLTALLGSNHDFVVCGEAESAAAALLVMAEARPDLAVVDISLKGDVDGIELTNVLAKESPSLRVLVLSMHAEPAYARRALAAGARGYMNKREAPESLIGALSIIREGGTYLSDDIRRRLE